MEAVSGLTRREGQALAGGALDDARGNAAAVRTPRRQADWIRVVSEGAPDRDVGAIGVGSCGKGADDGAVHTAPVVQARGEASFARAGLLGLRVGKDSIRSGDDHP